MGSGQRRRRIEAVLAARTLRRSPRPFLGGIVALSVSVTMSSAAGIVLVSASAAGEDPATGESGRAVFEQAASLVALLAGLGAFVTVFLVASTFAFNVAQRRQELALLRLVGASRGQVQRLVLLEAALAACAATLIGIVLCLPAALALAGSLVAVGVLPSGLSLRLAPSDVVAPLLVATALAAVVTFAGTIVAARRAGRVGPLVALSVASVDSRVMTRSRSIAGIALLAVAGVMLILIPRVPTDGQLPVAMFVAEPLVVALTLLAPTLLRPLIAVGVYVARLGGGEIADLAAANTRGNVGRTASTAAPILLTVGLSTSLLGGTAVLAAANRANAEHTYISDLVVMSPVSIDRTVEDLAAVDGVVAAVGVVISTADVTAGRAVRRYPVLGVTGSDPAHVLGLGDIDGDLARLQGATVAVSRTRAHALGVGVGEVVALRMRDHQALELEVVAVFDGPPLDPPLLVPFALVEAHPGADGGIEHAHTGASVHLAIGDAGVVIVAAAIADRFPDLSVSPTRDWLDSVSDARTEGMAFGARILAGFALAYTLVAIANTVIMSFGKRANEFALVRSIGATRSQLQRMVLWEGTLVAALGIVSGAVAATVGLVGLLIVLGSIGLQLSVQLPWVAFTVIALGCVAETVVTASVATAVITRGPLRPPASGPT